MAELVVNRGPSTDQGTFSKAVLDGTLSLDWLELPDRDNIPNKSCIIASTYEAIPYFSPHLGYWVYLFQGVQGRSDVEIHIANWGGDTDKGYYCELKGCAAPGYGTGQLVTPTVGPQNAVLNSGTAFKDFMKMCNGEKLLVTINPYTGDIA